MQRVMSRHGLVIAALFVAASAWWLANTSLQASIGFANVPVLGAQAAFVLVLGQAMLIGLLAVQHVPDTFRTAVLAAGSLVVPVWPLLALIWLTSELSMFAIASTQVAAFLLAVAVALAGKGVSRLAVGDEPRELLRTALGVAAAAALWIARSQLHLWVTA